MLRVYVETSVWGMAAPEQSPVLRRPTLEFLDQCAGRLYQAHISPVVANEIRQAPPAAQEHILRAISDVDPLMLSISPAAEELAERFLKEGVPPPRRMDDARHVACALVNQLDLLVSWNYRHIANVRKALAFNAIAVLSGLRAGLEIHTPLEVLGWT